MSPDRYKRTRRPGTDRRWTLLFIGDHGNVITLKRFKAIVIAAGCLFCLMVAGLGVLFLINQKTFRQNKNLQQQFQNSRQQIETLRHDKEILMARLVLAESHAKENVAGNPSQKQNSTGADPAASQPQKVSTSKSVAGPQKKSPAAPKALTEPAVTQTPDTEAVLSVAVENFRLAREPDNKNISAQFKIKNTSTEVQRVAGHAVVVLKGADLGKDQWLVMPAVRLAGNAPSGKRGKAFSILCFRTMQFTSKAPNYSDQFQTAAVYVFAKTGQLLLEQQFAVKLPPLPVATSDTPSGETPSRETQPAETPPRQKPAGATPPRETPPSEAPPSEAVPGEMPAGDDLMDSLETAPPIF